MKIQLIWKIRRQQIISPAQIMRKQQVVQMQSMEMKKQMDAETSQKTVKRNEKKKKKDYCKQVTNRSDSINKNRDIIFNQLN